MWTYDRAQDPAQLPSLAYYYGEGRLLEHIGVAKGNHLMTTLEPSPMANDGMDASVRVVIGWIYENGRCAASGQSADNGPPARAGSASACGRAVQ